MNIFNSIFNETNIWLDFIMAVSGWVAYSFSYIFLWRVWVDAEFVTKWLWAVPATAGFLMEHGITWLFLFLFITKGIGTTTDKGVKEPIKCPRQTNILFWVLWDIIVLVPIPIKIAMILIGGGIAVIWRFRGPLRVLLGRIPGGIRALISKVRRRPPTP